MPDLLRHPAPNPPSSQGGTGAADRAHTTRGAEPQEHIMSLAHPDLAKIHGRFTREDARKLKWPIAWSGAPDSDYEDALHALADEAIALIDQTPDAVAVQVVNGEITSVEVA